MCAATQSEVITGCPLHIYQLNTGVVDDGDDDPCDTSKHSTDWSDADDNYLLPIKR